MICVFGVSWTLTLFVTCVQASQKAMLPTDLPPHPHRPIIQSRIQPHGLCRRKLYFRSANDVLHAVYSRHPNSAGDISSTKSASGLTSQMVRRYQTVESV